jgi:hypothetical protein
VWLIPRVKTLSLILKGFVCPTGMIGFLMRWFQAPVSCDTVGVEMPRVCENVFKDNLIGTGDYEEQKNYSQEP